MFIRRAVVDVKRRRRSVELQKRGARAACPIVK